MAIYTQSWLVYSLYKLKSAPTRNSRACCKCGFETTKEHILVSHQADSFCPPCYLRGKSLHTRHFFVYPIIGIGVMAVFYMGYQWSMTSFDVVLDVMAGTWTKLGALTFFVLALPMAVIAHECGHAITGRIAGFELVHVSIGLCKIRRKFMFLGTRILIRTIPISGYVIGGTPGGREFGAWRWILFFVGGGAVNFLIVVILIWKFEVLSLSPNDLHPPDGLGFLQALVWSNLLIGILTWLPFMGSTSLGKVPSDGLAILKILFSKEQILKDQKVGLAVGQAFDFRLDADYLAAKTVIEKALTDHPDNLNLKLNYAVSLIENCDFSGAEKLLTAIRLESELPANLKMYATMYIVLTGLLQNVRHPPEAM